MSFKLFSPDGGELAESGAVTRIEQIPYLVKGLAEVFSKMRQHTPNNLELSYCFEVRPDYKKTVEFMLYDIEREGLPPSVTFYEVDGKKVFDMRGPVGGVIHSCCFYLITKGWKL